MARRPNPRIRARLRDQAVEYVLSHGAGDLTLRPLAKALKTNARMLIYHFGSREGVMREILAGLREREDARIQTWFRTSKKKRTLPEFLRWYWERMSTPRARPALRLVFELYALALRRPQDYHGVLEAPLAYWRKLTEQAGLAAQVDPIEATLLLAATRGLFLDLCATGDRARVGSAMKILSRLVESHAKPAK
jgi:AcrR family transcriptional regulator